MWQVPAPAPPSVPDSATVNQRSEAAPAAPEPPVRGPHDGSPAPQGPVKTGGPGRDRGRGRTARPKTAVPDPLPRGALAVQQQSALAMGPNPAVRTTQLANLDFPPCGAHTRIETPGPAARRTMKLQWRRAGDHWTPTQAARICLSGGEPGITKSPTQAANNCLLSPPQKLPFFNYQNTLPFQIQK